MLGGIISLPLRVKPSNMKWMVAAESNKDRDNQQCQLDVHSACAASLQLKEDKDGLEPI